ncbi:MAG: type I restriction-modification system subunit M [Candidatus Berkelbacteria bacterium]|nr:type I restriction-modification system subunit M [Candidatus Berkelbacteria bacterium]
MSNEQKQLLEKQLWAVANALRGKMNADEYKNYILGFIFYKYLSEKLEIYVNEKLLASEKFKYSEIEENSKDGAEYLGHIKAACISHLGFFLKPSELFSHLVKKGKGQTKDETTFILEDLKNVLNTIEQTSMGTASEDDFKGLFGDVSLTSDKLGSSENKKNDVIVEVLSLLAGIDFRLDDAKSDLLGDAYEYLIGEFASGAGKKGGEFYTPAQVSRLLAQIVSADKKRLRSVFDPTCGSGSLLLRLKEYAEVSDYYGQELNPTTYNLARMNMILHGVHFDHFKIMQGDTLTDDMHPDLKAEAIVANPPFSAEWKGEKDPALVHDDRFSQYGRLAPKGAADYAFVTHMIYHLADNGTMAVVLPHGVLFRSGAEGQIRKHIIEKQNFLDAVIGLPANLFYATSIPATVLVFKKCRRDDEDILFIDASREFEKGKNQNHLTNENIAKIFETYSSRKEIEKYSHRASLDEIKENDFNLNIPRYVDTFEEEEEIDLGEVVAEIKKIDADMIGIDQKITGFCKELGIKSPFGGEK